MPSSRKHILRLQRRADHLAARLQCAADGIDMAFDRAEYRSLTWAIEQLGAPSAHDGDSGRYVHWCRKQATEHGDCALSLIRACVNINDSGIDAAVEWAREAGHYGRLALRQTPIGNEKGEQMTETNDVIYYGPHACSVCGETIVKASAEHGGAEFDPPAALMRIYQRGAESGNVDIVYPQTWKPHVHGSGTPLDPASASPAA
jgi:hypothetical protein